MVCAHLLQLLQVHLIFFLNNSNMAQTTQYLKGQTHTYVVNKSCFPFNEHLNTHLRFLV